MLGMFRFVLLLASILTFVGGCDPPSGNTPTNNSSGAAAPDFTARDSFGNTFHMSEHLGKKVILLDFWSTYCEPCKAAFPHMREMYTKLKDKGFIVVGVAMDGPETVAEVRGFQERYSLNFPIVLDEDSRVASLYNPKKAMPLSVLIDRTGKIAVVREGFNPGDEELIERDVKKALGQGPTANTAEVR